MNKRKQLRRMEQGNRIGQGIKKGRGRNSDGKRMRRGGGRKNT